MVLIVNLHFSTNNLHYFLKYFLSNFFTNWGWLIPRHVIINLHGAFNFCIYYHFSVHPTRIFCNKPHLLCLLNYNIHFFFNFLLNFTPFKFNFVCQIFFSIQKPPWNSSAYKFLSIFCTQLIFVQDTLFIQPTQCAYIQY